MRNSGAFLAALLLFIVLQGRVSSVVSDVHVSYSYQKSVRPITSNELPKRQSVTFQSFENQANKESTMETQQRRAWEI